MGDKTARDLAENFPSLDKLIAASQEDLERVPQIGPVVAESVASFFRQPQVERLVEKLTKAGLTLTEPQRERPAGGALSGKTVVFTGELSSMTREDAEELVRLNGGTPSSSVSKKTGYVVVGKDPGSKADKARQLGVQTLDEDAFLKLVGEE